MEEYSSDGDIKPQEPKTNWKTYLDSENAVRNVYLIFGFIAITGLMIFLQTRTSAICCGDWDGYYHIRWSQLLWENFSSGKWLPSFDWLPLTVLSPQKYNDHHFLFHLLQVPFLWFFEPVNAAKAAAIFYGSLAIFSVYWLMYRYKIDNLVFWLLALLVCGNSFYYRMNMAKAPPLTIIITIAGIYLLFERRYKWLLPLMFAFVWTYSLFPLLWIAALIWVVIIAWNEHKFEWQPLAYTTGGVVLGNLINPYFPNNLTLFWEHFVTKLTVGSDFAVSVGQEWYAYSGIELMTHFPVALIAMLVGYIVFVPRGSKVPEKATFFLAFVTMLLAAQFRSKRFAEYFPPFAILFAAFSLQAFKNREAIKMPAEFTRDIEDLLDSDKKTDRQEMISIIKQSAVYTLGTIIFIYFLFLMVGMHALGINHGGLINNIKNNEKDDEYRRAMTFAVGQDANGLPNIPEGERIFNCNWDDFPKLFFLDTKHSYVYGLDPNYLFSADPELYKSLKEITDGTTEEAGPIIKEKFGAKYVFADAKENDSMIAKLLDSGWGEIIYEDDEARILKIRDQKGEPDEPEEDEPETEEEKRLLDEQEKLDEINAAKDLSDEDEKANLAN